MTNYTHRDPLDHIQDLFEQRSNTTDRLFRQTLKGEILQVCDTFRVFAKMDECGVWHNYCVINDTVILVTKPRWWKG
jgi:hypothetical protein